MRKPAANRTSTFASLPSRAWSPSMASRPATSCGSRARSARKRSRSPRVRISRSRPPEAAAAASSRAAWSRARSRRLPQVLRGRRWSTRRDVSMSESPSLRSKFSPQGVFVATPNTWSATWPSCRRGRSTWPRRPRTQEVAAPEQGVRVEIDDGEPAVDAQRLRRNRSRSPGDPVQGRVQGAGPEQPQREREAQQPDESDPEAPSRHLHPRATGTGGPAHEDSIVGRPGSRPRASPGGGVDPGANVLISRARVAAPLPGAALSRRVPAMKVRPLHDRILVKRLDSEDQDQGRHHHPRHREGEAPGGARRRGGPGQGQRGRQGDAPRREEGRQGAVRQVLRERDHARRATST